MTSSNVYTAARSPFLRALATYCMETVDLPTPAGPSSSVVVPVVSPPSSISSRVAMPLG